MSQNDQADRKTAQAFGFHQLRQACEISSLRQEITRILAGTGDLQILIENEVERVRQRLGALDTADSHDPAKLSPLLSDAMAALIEMEDRIADRRMELNESFRMYNTAVTSFPWEYLASVSGFLWKDYSHASAGRTLGPDITPELYQQLVPLVRTMGGPK